MAPHQIRPIRVEGNIAYVPLTRGYEAVISVADVPLVDGVNWYAMAAGGTIYAVRKGPRPKQRKIYMHRAILSDPDGLEVDHINGEGLDNRRCNLRAATRAQNARNSHVSNANTSGYKGVSWDKRDRKWQAFIAVNGLRHFLGRFACPTAASLAYARASRELHKEFGRTA